MDSNLIEEIYEAAVLPDRWPPILQRVADQVDAMGACFIAQSPGGTSFVTSPGVERQLLDYISEGWADDPERTAPLFIDQYPGFRLEIDYRSAEEVSRLPAHAQFLDPRGMFAGAATAIQGTEDRSLFLAFEGFPTHQAAGTAVPMLDTLRPHFARAISLTALHTQRTQVVVDSLALAGAAAAVVGRDGRLRAANTPFVARMAERMVEGSLGLRFTDPFLQRQFAGALERHRAERGAVQSVAVRNNDGEPPFAIHLLPIKGAARELCESDGVLLLIADGANAAIPDADLLRLLFDLTPAEARLTRLIAQGHAVADASCCLAIAEATARVHLRSIFLKTGVSRQTE
jgi:DNA-binding CsgD family transcriptional regulator